MPVPGNKARGSRHRHTGIPRRIEIQLFIPIFAIDLLSSTLHSIHIHTYSHTAHHRTDNHPTVRAAAIAGKLLLLSGVELAPTPEPSTPCLSLPKPIMEVLHILYPSPSQ